MVNFATMFNWLTPLYLLAIFGLVCYFIRPSPEAVEKEPKAIRWTAIEAVGVSFFLYFAGQLIGGFLAYIYPLVHGWNSTQSTNWLQSVSGQFIYITITEAVTVYLLYIFLRRRKSVFKAIGLHGGLNWRDIGTPVVGFIIVFL